MTVRPTTQHDIQQDDENTSKPNFAVVVKILITGSMYMTYSGVDLGTGQVMLFISGSGVTGGDAHNHTGSMAPVAYTSLLYRPAAETNSNDIFRCDSPGGAPGWTGTISGTPSGAIVSYTNVSGTPGALIPTSTSQLAKMRLYNITRGDYGLISNATSIPNAKITLTANAPVGWANGDRITIASNTIISAGTPWVDLEITTGMLGRLYIFPNLHIISATAGDAVSLHPYETFSVSKQASVVELTVNGHVIGMYLIKVVSNVFSLAWSGTPTSVFIRESGYLE